MTSRTSPSLRNHPFTRFFRNACWPAARARPPEAINGRYRALVAEGDPSLRQSLESHLAALERAVAVDFAEDGGEALEKAGAAQYDLVFIGATVRGFDGYEICSRLRKMPAYKQTPIVMVSGEPSPVEAMRGVKAGCTTYLAKPLRREALQNLSRRVLA
jgi:CheY-like chemotaxis protein